MSPDVSVVIPVRNGERFIREALDSVQRQSGFALQIIVVDNLSTDGTVETVKSYGHPVALTSESCPGPGAARNAGAQVATGKYLAFLDADDVWPEGKLEQQMHELSSRPGVSLIFGHCLEFHDAALTAEQKVLYPCRPQPYPWLAASTCLLELESFRKTGGFPEVMAGEFIAWFGWAQSLGLREYVMPEVCLHRRIHAENTSRGPGFRAAFIGATKWLLDRRRQAQTTSKA